MPVFAYRGRGAHGELVAGTLEAARPHLRGHTLTDRALALVFAGRTTVAEAMKVAVQLEE